MSSTTDTQATLVVAERLRELPHVGAASPTCLAALSQAGTVRTYQRDDPIVVEGEPTQCLFVVLRGRVKMWRATPVGRNVILALFGPGETFGTVASLASGVADASMTALEDTQCLAVERRDLFRLLGGSEPSASELLPLLMGQLAECKNCMVELTGYRVEMRFAHILLRLADHVGRVDDAGTLIPLKLSRQELADMAGTTLETAIRLMSRWHKQDLVETRADGFLVRDRRALEQLAQG